MDSRVCVKKLLALDDLRIAFVVTGGGASLLKTITENDPKFLIDFYFLRSKQSILNYLGFQPDNVVSLFAVEAFVKKCAEKLEFEDLAVAVTAKLSGLNTGTPRHEAYISFYFKGKISTFEHTLETKTRKNQEKELREVVLNRLISFLLWKGCIK